ncbi:hypothetical protein ARMSODRAFT_541406 [Armillaria solidipes]|uniref:Uncharacterized protein n=1 Tax=Armillaria solidipes TaxID=1076256 RepID=A0A2H3BFM4_9AGAR|nr:hypothetical protein ARMSODRAFT_541406 [Armillaria solidipes]
MRGGRSVRAGELTFGAAGLLSKWTRSVSCLSFRLLPRTRLALCVVLFLCSLRLLPHIALSCRRIFITIRLMTSGSTITIPRLEVSAYSSESSSQRIPTYAIAQI